MLDEEEQLITGGEIADDIPAYLGGDGEEYPVDEGDYESAKVLYETKFALGDNPDLRQLREVAEKLRHRNMSSGDLSQEFSARASDLIREGTIDCVCVDSNGKITKLDGEDYPEMPAMPEMPEIPRDAGKEEIKKMIQEHIKTCICYNRDKQEAERKIAAMSQKNES